MFTRRRRQVKAFGGTVPLARKNGRIWRPRMKLRAADVERTLIGMLTPSSNTVLEPYTAFLLHDLFPSVTAHFGRFHVTEISLGDASRSQFELEPLLAAAEQLADARVDVIAWNGTSASWLGFDRDEVLCRAITERTGVPATSAILALNELLQKTGVRRLGLVTPYVAEVQELIIANFRAIGIDTVAEERLGITDNFAFSEVSEQQLVAMCREVARARPDAIAIVCTNMRGSLIVPELERELGIPIHDSVAFTLWKALAVAGVSTVPLRRWGGPFAVGGGKTGTG
ncbi:MAG TPA: aspartate/glutamate racemase family protein [Vicinamibacterales bacterium]|nr:aspartate/glutamate racemase family protein [Vicinamibacterales bacterium]